MEYLTNPAIKEAIANGATYQKSARTLLRIPLASELGTEFNTYVKDGEGFRKESLNVVRADVIVGKNPTLLGINDSGQEVYNEWLIPLETAVKNYGQDVIDGLSSEHFTAHKKKATLKALEVTSEVMNQLGVDGDTLEITVSWSKEPMIAKIGDFLTDGGYSISKHDMQDYELL